MELDKLRILLLDDDEVDRMAISRYIQKEDLPYEVDMVTSISEARQKLSDNEYDLALLDYLLPDGKGLDLLKTAKEVPVIFVTGSGDENIAVQALRGGAYDYLIKDPERNYLIVLPATINNVMERKKAEKALKESEIKHRVLLNCIKTPILALKEDITIFYCNDTYAEFVKLSIEQLEGRKLIEVFPRINGSETYKAYLDVLQTGKTMVVEGKYENRYLSSSIYRTPWGILAVAEDITERKAAQEALVKANEGLERRVAERTVELARANDELQRSYNDTIIAITAAMDAKDSYTRGHSERVRDIAMCIGDKLGLPAESLKKLSYAALLHDIGKIGVSDLLLTKKGGLTKEEYEEVKMHPVIGGRLVGEIELLKDVAPIISAHHEHFDGSGYPKGLRGQEIPIEARIIGVADAYESMISDRPYRKAYEMKEVIKRLDQASGTQLDPLMVEKLKETI
ncbi:MAG: HD domain-containing phosphohydrolase [Candidatus Edwardsbacteria bacterium]|nr:HD domain-containing phosphohydrolase [Candidatus Edwardsbacteria bacterium]